MTTDKLYTRFDVRILALAGFVLLALFLLILVWAGGAMNLDPLWAYYHNPDIQLICLGALLTDVAILASVVGNVVAIRSQHKTLAERLSLMLTFLALIGAILTWLELWCGSTFYYGEVRDKQGLPFTANNGGPVGSFVFLTYVLWSLPLGKPRRIPVLVAKGMGTLILFLAHWLILRLVEEPWKLWQS